MSPKRILNAIILIVLLACATVSFAADKKVKYVVYYDDKYPVSWMSRAASGELKELLVTIGFTEMGAADLAAWMKSAVDGDAEGTLLVMAQDVVPDLLVGAAPGADALIRQYLDKGGSVIWISDVPFYFVGKANGDKEKWDYLGGRGVLGFDTVGNWKGQTEATPVGEGAKWGLNKAWLSIRAVKPSDVTKVLAKDKDGAASAWIKEYAKGNPGFIRLWDYGVKNFDDGMGEDLYKVISNNFADFAGKKKFGSIYTFKPSDYRPLVHRNGDGLEREVQVSVFDNSPGGKSYKLTVSKKDLALKTVPLFEDARTFFKKNVIVPEFYPDETLKLVAVDASGAEEVVDEKTLDDPAFFCEAAWTVSPLRNPVDMGAFLVPGDRVLMGTDSMLEVGISALFPGDGPGRPVSLKLQVTDRDKNVLSEVGQKSELVPGTMEHLKLETAKGKFKAGKYLAEFTVSDAAGAIYEEKKWLIVREPLAAQTDFGAYEARIDYLGSVPQYDRKTKEWSDLKWDDVWEKGPYNDIVVAFPNGNRFVFWRGSGYVPFWASWANIGMTYEWIESAWGRGGLVDCLEVLQDKECRYSRPRIVSSTPARVIVKWRYAIVDLEYTIADDEWGEETFIFYPDGFGTRKAMGYLLPEPNWHESNEMITLTPAGVNPFDLLPSNMVTVLSPDGSKREEISYPQPSGSWEKNTPAVFRIHYSSKDNNTPVMVSKNFDRFIQQYDGWKVDGRYISPSYWGVHWPVTRGYPTTMGAPPRWRENPAHASIITIETTGKRKQANRTHDFVTWQWLIGNTDMPDADLLGYTANWIEPVGMKMLSGGTGGEYDAAQRGYVIKSNGGKVAAQWTGAADRQIVNPVLIIENCGLADADVSVNGKKLSKSDYKYGLEKSWDGSTGVVWIGAVVPANATVEVK